MTTIKAVLKRGDKTVSVDFPCRENDLLEKLQQIDAESSLLPTIVIDKITMPTCFGYFEGKRLNLDELNYLAKRMDSFDEKEMSRFYEAVMHREDKSLKDLINLRQLFSCMREISDYIIADCVSDASDLISAMAKTEADSIIQLVTPDLKCMTYYSSNAEQFAAISDRAVRVMNIREKDMYLPKEEVSAYFKDIRFRMPFSFGLNKQAYTGTLSERLSDNKYRKAMSELAKAVM